MLRDRQSIVSASNVIYALNFVTSIKLVNERFIFIHFAESSPLVFVITK